jgi:hypothetical protein
VANPTTGEIASHAPWVLKGISWREKDGGTGAAVIKEFSFLRAKSGQVSL